MGASRARLWRPAVTIVAIVTAVTAASSAAFADCRVIDPELQGFYQGGCKKGLAQGFGIARGTAGYEGEFHQGLKQGRGVKTWAWGDRYEGEFIKDRRHGRGMYVWGVDSPWAGERFVGDYVADKREGWGTYFWPTGDRFEGVWKDDRRYGTTAMEQRREAAEAARTAAQLPGVQVCSWSPAGIGHKVMRVGTIETQQGRLLQVRLQRLEGLPEALGASPSQPGALLKEQASDWMPCS